MRSAMKRGLGRHRDRADDGANRHRLLRDGRHDDTKVGIGKKADPAKVAKAGFEAMLRGDGREVAGFANKMQAMMTRFTSDDRLAEMHKKIAEPGSARY
jgi:hypothetical protein